MATQLSGKGRRRRFKTILETPFLSRRNYRGATAN